MEELTGYHNKYLELTKEELGDALKLEGLMQYKFVQAIQTGNDKFLCFFVKEVELEFVQVCGFCQNFDRNSNFCSLHGDSASKNDTCDDWENDTISNISILEEDDN